MNRILVAIFNAELAACEGQLALKALHERGEITVYATAIVASDASGTLSVREAPDGGPAGQALSVLTLSLTGLTAEPRRIPAEPAARSLAVYVVALARAGIDADFVEEVTETLTPGKVAVLAEVQETWVTPVNLRLGNLGALLFRRRRAEVAEDCLARESALLVAELASLEEELRHASAVNRAMVQNEIEDIRQRLEYVQVMAEARALQARSEMAGKIETLHEQSQQAANRQAVRTEEHIAEVKADYASRGARLEQALRLVEEALSREGVPCCW